MKQVDIDNIKNVICLGIGGGDVYYIAKFFFFLGKDIKGFDIRESKKTKDLEDFGVKIFYKNPSGKLPLADLVVYSDSLADSLINKIKEKNRNTFFIEAGELKRYLLNLFQSNDLNSKQIEALVKCDMFPLFNFDSGEMKLIGITGTDGKTTVVSMLYHLLSKLSYNPGMISTVGMYIGKDKDDIGFHVTTPSSHSILESLELMKQKGCTHAIIECTSQGLYMGRLAGLKFDAVAYTNIKREHLGYHKSWKRYVDAKSLLIRENLKERGYAVLNIDDTRGYKYLNRFNGKKLYYSMKKNLTGVGNLLKARNIGESVKGISFEVSNQKINIPILGKYNVSNSLAAMSVLKALGIDEKDSAPLFQDFPTVEGRMNILQREPFKVIIDFAHTPNGLLNALKSVRKITGENNKIILVFGCAAKRDEYKRPVMGRYAKRYADITILTAEDCRSESLKKINDQIEKGWKEFKIAKKRDLIRFDNDKENVSVRRRAIQKALSLAKDGDTALITGKGHEKSLCFGLVEYPWSDIEETKKINIH